MRFGHRNQPVETLAPNRADEALADRVGLGTTWWRFKDLDTEVMDRFVEVCGKDAIAIMQQVPVSRIEPDGLAQLLQGPGGRRDER